MEEVYTEMPLSNVRKIIAAAMYNSLQNSAQLTHHLSANASRMLQLRKEVKNRMKEGYAYNITLNDMVCYAVIRALKIHPGANAQFLDGKIRQFKKVNLGLAVDTERGLMVPALLNADDLSLPGLSAQLKGAGGSLQGAVRYRPTCWLPRQQHLPFQTWEITGWKCLPRSSTCPRWPSWG